MEYQQMNEEASADNRLSAVFDTEDDCGEFAGEPPILPVLDGAHGEIDPWDILLAHRRTVAQDTSRQLGERLEAFEDIVESEVGDTSLVRARNVEREVGLRQIYLKFEGGNPTGTQKDRIAFAQVMDALRRGFDAVAVATCGNYGVAVALAASLARLNCVVHIPEGYHTRRLDEIEELGAKTIRVPGDYECALEVSRAMAEKDELYDANPGGRNTSIQFHAYGEMAYEIYDELRDAPAAVAVPVSNGTTLAGIYRGFLSLYRRGKTSRIPKFVAGSSYGKNPIVQSILKNSETCEDLDPDRIRETTVNEPLINWRSADGDHALAAVRATKGWASYSSDKAMAAFSRLIREKEGLHVLPASTAGLIALVTENHRNSLSSDRYVAVLTGRRE
jgi:threonine synthase